MDIGYLIKSINDKLKVSADADLKSRELTLSQSRVLGFISQNGGQVTQKEIENYLGVSHPTVVGIVSRMEQNGFLDFRADRRDRRNKLVLMTEKAKTAGAELSGIIAAQEARMTNGLTPEEICELERMLKVLYKNLA